MSKKRKELTGADPDSTPAKKLSPDTAAESHSPGTTPPTISSKENKDKEDKVKKKKRKKDKDMESEDIIMENNADDATPPTTCISSKEDQATEDKVKKKKKRKKDEDLQSAASHTQSNEQVSTEEQVAVDASEAEGVRDRKKKKKRKKHKHEMDTDEGQGERNHKSRADQSPDRKHDNEHVPMDLGTVDTSILEQASVNLGLPMADETSGATDASVTEEQSKKKKKKKDKDKKSKTTKEPENTPNGQTDPDTGAVSYLRLWHSNRKAWKFNERFQVRLIHNLYSSEKLGDEDFGILLHYLDGMQGKSREKTREDAQKIVTDETEEGDKIVRDRARQIFQMLS